MYPAILRRSRNLYCTRILEKYNFLFQVKWAKDNLDGYLNFYSVSGDGRVTNWTIVKTALWCTDVLSITFCKALVNFPEKEKHKSIKGITLQSIIILYGK
jgi:hypothetical protein